MDFSFPYARLFHVDFQRETVARNQNTSYFTINWWKSDYTSDFISEPWMHFIFAYARLFHMDFPRETVEHNQYIKLLKHRITHQ